MEIDLGSALTLAGLAVTWLLYQLQRASEARSERAKAVALLTAVESGLTGPDGWGPVFFENQWVGSALARRVTEDFDAVLAGGYLLVYEVPTYPLRVLVESRVAGDLIGREVIAAANMALFRVGAFNQLVRQQTAFYTRHLAEIADEALPEQRRRSIAAAAAAQSRLVHGEGIGRAAAPGGWFSELAAAVHDNAAQLQQRRSALADPGVASGVAFVAAAAIVTVLALI